MSTLYLHIGTPKTGTTALQQFMFSNQDKLADAGIFYRDREVVNGETVKNFTYWIYDRYTDKALREEKFEELYEIAEKYPKLIISNERIWDTKADKHAFWEDLKGRLDAHAIALKVVVYLRRQDQYIYSKWGQIIKKGRGGETRSYTFKEYLESREYKWRLMDYAKILKRIASHIGDENLIVRVYEQEQFDGGTIFSDFFHAIDGPDISSYALSISDVNSSLKGNVLEARRLLNQYGFPSEEFDIRKLLKEVQTILVQKEKLVEKTEFSAEDRKRYLAQYEDGNRFIAGHYLGREDGVLFYEDVDSISYDAGEYGIDDLMPVFAELLAAALRMQTRQK